VAKLDFLTLDNPRNLFNKITTSTIEELKSALRTNSKMTVFRKKAKGIYIYFSVKAKTIKRQEFFKEKV